MTYDMTKLTVLAAAIAAVPALAFAQLSLGDTTAPKILPFALLWKRRGQRCSKSSWKMV